MKADVYFVPLQDGKDLSRMADQSVRLLRESGLEETFKKDQLVAVKQHFGERSDGHYVKPAVTARLVELLKQRGARPFITDTTTLYRGRRSNGLAYTQTAWAHGFTEEAVGAPFIAADGLKGLDAVRVDISGKHFEQVRIASAAYHADTALVVTHVTGHCNSGLGGAIKNVGMGLAPRSGKLLQHSNTAVRQDHDKCIACGACVRWCPADAIELVQNGSRQYARIDPDACIGCGECTAICPTGAMLFDWSSSGQMLSERMVEYALGFVKIKQGKAVYLNYAVEITRNCDCAGTEKPVLEAVGILASSDLLACEQATVDVINEATGEDFFARLWPQLDYRLQLEYGQRVGLGTRDYRLIRL